MILKEAEGRAIIVLKMVIIIGWFQYLPAPRNFMRFMIKKLIKEGFVMEFDLDS